MRRLIARLTSTATSIASMCTAYGASPIAPRKYASPSRQPISRSTRGLGANTRPIPARSSSARRLRRCRTPGSVLDIAPAAPHRDRVIDLDRYFARIGYDGPRDATLATLNGIANAHVQAIPFENLDVLLGRGIDLGLDAVQRKLVDDRRGGYCFEQNSLLLAVLGELGFEARPLSARVRMQRPRDFVPARTHLVVRVELDGPWLAAVGIGSMSMGSAIRLAFDEPQGTPHPKGRPGGGGG